MRSLPAFFDELNVLTRTWIRDIQVLGIMSFGNAAKWDLSAGGSVPALRVVSPIRWFAVGDHRFEYEFFVEFLSAWGGRFRRRMEGIVAGEFED